MPYRQGTVLRDRYRIVRPIGQGGMGSIFLAEDLRLPGRQCALKEVIGDPNLSPAAQQQAREQFYREASVLARLDHPGLPKVSDYFSDVDADVLVMDYVPGQDLKSLIDEAREAGRFLPEAEVMSWAKQIIDAMTYMHASDPPVVHRDIKPGNLQLTPNGLIKLVDFGLVKVLAPDERTVTVVQGRGTVHFTPLEQYGGDTGHTDVRSDIYALGATLYNLLSNQPPAEAKVRFLNAETLIPIRELNPRVSWRVERAVMWALQLHPDERPADIATFKRALFDGVFPEDVGVPMFGPATSSEWLSQAWRDPTQRYMAITAGLLMVLAVITTFARLQ